MQLFVASSASCLGLVIVNKLTDHMCVGMGMAGAANTAPLTGMGSTGVSSLLITSIQQKI